MISKIYDAVTFVKRREGKFLVECAGPIIATAFMKLAYYPWAKAHVRNRWKHNIVDALKKIHLRGLFTLYPSKRWIYYKLITSVDCNELHEDFMKYTNTRPDNWGALDALGFDSRRAVIMMDMYFRWASAQLSKNGVIKYTDAFKEIESLLDTYRYATKSTITRRRIINGHEIKIN